MTRLISSTAPHSLNPQLILYHFLTHYQTFQENVIKHYHTGVKLIIHILS